MAGHGIKQITFWARELRLPLFWLTDPGNGLVSDYDNLMISKGAVIHCFHLNDAEDKAASKGYRHFIRKGSLTHYRQTAEKLIGRLRLVPDEYSAAKVRKLPVEGLRKALFDLLRLLDAYSGVYALTEAFSMARFESSQSSRALLEGLGKVRLKLRKEGEPVFYVLLGVLLKDMARRFAIGVNDLFFYDLEEMGNLFEGNKVRADVLARRRRIWALLTIGARQKLFTGSRAIKLLKTAVGAVGSGRTLVGRTAMPGKVKGRVRLIIHDRRDVSARVASFKSGEILVTEMTRPDVVLACRRAAAIVTDEGGITSHAAVISRELKIPCVIGTGNATQVFKSGDLVEVDADGAIVKLVRRARRS